MPAFPAAGTAPHGLLPALWWRPVVVSRLGGGVRRADRDLARNDAGPGPARPGTAGPGLAPARRRDGGGNRGIGPAALRALRPQPRRGARLRGGPHADGGWCRA